MADVERIIELAERIVETRSRLADLEEQLKAAAGAAEPAKKKRHRKGTFPVAETMMGALATDPAKAWTARTMAREIGHRNVKSVSTALSAFVRDGLAERISEGIFKASSAKPAQANGVAHS